MDTLTKISIVVPAFNEEKGIVVFYSKLTAVIEKLSYLFEIIFVDDGSRDNTLAALRVIAGADSRVKVISFSRNFGHMIALSAGLDYATGKAVITMDADLQHPPEVIAELLKAWKKGADVVNTVRKEAKDIGLLKKMTAKGFYWLINKIGKINIRANTADFRLLDRQVVDALKSIKEKSRFLRGLICWVGYQQEFIEYQADQRTLGKTKYSISRMFSFAIDGITSFSSFPLIMATYVGLSIACLSFLYIIYAIYMKVSGQALTGWASVLVAVLFIGGIQLMFLGIIGEYLARVFEETKQRPLYLVKEKIGLE